MSTGITIAVAVTSLLNLLFTYGVVRRLKEHEARLAEFDPTGPLRSAKPAVGSAIPDFSATTSDDRSMDSAMLRTGDVYVGFFDTDCPPCREQLPEFANLSREPDTGQFAVFIAGGKEQAAQMSVPFDDRVFVVLEDESFPTAAAFGVESFPTLLALNDGVVTANAVSTADLVRLSPVRLREPM